MHTNHTPHARCGVAEPRRGFVGIVQHHAQTVSARLDTHLDPHGGLGVGEAGTRDRASGGGVDQVATGEGWPLQLISAVYVFGSYMRGAPELGDVDVAVNVDRHDSRWRSHFVNSLSSGRGVYSIIRMALRGRKRGISILFERDHGHDDVPMLRLWTRGESVEVVDYGPGVDTATGWLPSYSR